MGTARDHSPHLAHPRGLTRLQMSPLYAFPSLVFVPPPPIPRSGASGTRLHLRYDFHSALDRCLYSGLLQVPMRLMRIRLRCQTKMMPLIEEPVTSGLTVERGTAASAR